MSIRDSQRMSEVSARRGSHADADSEPVAAGIVGTFRRDMRAVAENPAGSLHLFVGYRRVQRASPAERAVVDRKAGTWPQLVELTDQPRCAALPIRSVAKLTARRARTARRCGRR